MYVGNKKLFDQLLIIFRARYTPYLISFMSKRIKLHLLSLSKEEVLTPLLPEKTMTASLFLETKPN